MKGTYETLLTQFIPIKPHCAQSDTHLLWVVGQSWWCKITNPDGKLCIIDLHLQYI